MFENFVHGKIQKENAILHNLTEISKENILKSKLSEFSKKYLLYDYPVQPDESEFLTRIEKSNKLYFNFAIRPKWTLLTFLFGNFESRPPNEIINKLNVFPFYNYYTDAIKDFIKSNFQIFVTKGELTLIIDETNKAIYEKLTDNINNLKIKNFFLQLYNLKYEDESNYNLESAIPFSFIKIFLEDKSYFVLKKKFDAVKNFNDKSEISMKDIIKILTDKYNKTGIINAYKTEDYPSELNSSAQNEEDSKKIEIEIPPADKNIILENENQKDTDTNEEILIEPVSEKIYSEQLLKATAESEKSASEIKTDKTGINESSVLKDLFDEKQFQKILNKIYNSDIIRSEKSLALLSSLKNWKEASKHLKEIFKNNRVDIYNKEVVNFVNVLNEYFKHKE